MWVRSTTTFLSPESLDLGNEYVRDVVLPATRRMQGCHGISHLVDRETGMTISTTTWRDEAALDASRAIFVSLREGAIERFDLLTPPVVSEYEVALMRRPEPRVSGSCARVAWAHVPREHFDRAVDWYNFDLVPRAEKAPGFAGASLLTNRERGSCVSTVAFESQQAMADTRSAGDRLRAVGSEQLGIEYLDVAEFDLVLAQLGMPEVI